jgi:GxxExxY protein
VPVPVTYRGITLDEGYRLDLLVEDLVIVEVKAVQEMHPICRQQTRTYLRLMNLQLGYLINFNVPLIKDGTERVICTRLPSS